MEYEEDSGFSLPFLKQIMLLTSYRLFFYGWLLSPNLHKADDI